MKRINYDIQQLRGFVALAEESNFNQAAQQVHISPSALSRRIDSLEEALGIKLFNRTTRKVELTSSGRVFLERVRTALNDLEQATLVISDIAIQKTGTVLFSCIPTMANHYLPAALQTFTSSYPKIKIRMLDDSEGAVVGSILSGEVDFGIGYILNQIPEIDFELLLQDDLMLAVPNKHPLARLKAIDWQALENERIISVSRQSGTRKLIDDSLSKVGINPNLMVEVNRIATMAELVGSGLGIAIIPKLAITQDLAKKITLIPLSNPPIGREIGILKRHGTVLKPLANIFIDHLRRAIDRH